MRGDEDGGGVDYVVDDQSESSTFDRERPAYKSLTKTKKYTFEGQSMLSRSNRIVKVGQEEVQFSERMARKNHEREMKLMRIQEDNKISKLKTTFQQQTSTLEHECRNEIRKCIKKYTRAIDSATKTHTLTRIEEDKQNDSDIKQLYSQIKDRQEIEYRAFKASLRGEIRDMKGVNDNHHKEEMKNYKKHQRDSMVRLTSKLRRHQHLNSHQREQNYINNKHKHIRAFYSVLRKTENANTERKSGLILRQINAMRVLLLNHITAKHSLEIDMLSEDQKREREKILKVNIEEERRMRRILKDEIKMKVASFKDELINKHNNTHQNNINNHKSNINNKPKTLLFNNNNNEFNIKHPLIKNDINKEGVNNYFENDGVHHNNRAYNLHMIGGANNDNVSDSSGRSVKLTSLLAYEKDVIREFEKSQRDRLDWMLKRQREKNGLEWLEEKFERERRELEDKFQQQKNSLIVRFQKDNSTEKKRFDREIEICKKKHEVNLKSLEEELGKEVDSHNRLFDRLLHGGQSKNKVQQQQLQNYDLNRYQPQQQQHYKHNLQPHKHNQPYTQTNYKLQQNIHHSKQHYQHSQDNINHYSNKSQTDDNFFFKNKYIQQQKQQQIQHVQQQQNYKQLQKFQHPENNNLKMASRLYKSTPDFVKLNFDDEDEEADDVSDDSDDVDSYNHRFKSKTTEKNYKRHNVKFKDGRHHVVTQSTKF